ncbi:KaiC/GvpD/RAD55 family RecA-like ATPase [Methanofollis sp. W23]|uniref:RAD55 family ATPase n=1 Tax=Methanofollis sp. W23 TaxID=2817849 RepID=UPI001AE4F6D3|nr:RAD55 family ATPase [Methanofollis sp. W23]MBP2146349.1 KaiC/GvpD/RAD55 family RecA-like ATPase [Methanofollis sp. W23]
MWRRTDLKIPTGIPSLDPVLEGGVPSGSMVLLLGDIGSGMADFLRTSAISLAKEKTDHRDGDETGFTGEVVYITVTRVKDDILGEVALSVSPEVYPIIEEGVRFEDLSEIYFDSSIVPIEWYSDDADLLARMHQRSRRDDILPSLAALLSETAPQSVIIVDSLTELATMADTPDHWRAFTGFLHGLQRVAKRWGSVIYLPLAHGVLARPHELEVMDSADAVILFQWEELQGMRRQRTMYVQKFRGVMPHLEERDLVKFAVRITPGNGFEVSNIRVVV